MCEERRQSIGFEPLVVTEDFELTEENGVPTVLLKTKPKKDKGSSKGQEHEESASTTGSTAEESQEEEEKVGDDDDEDEEEEEESGESSESQTGSSSTSSGTESSSNGTSDLNLIGSGSLKLCIKEQKKDVKLKAVIGEEKGRKVELKESPSCKSLQKMASFDFKNLSKPTYEFKLEWLVY